MHGFVNVFLAGVFAHGGNLNAAQLRLLLDDDRANQFSFTHKGAIWRKHRATTTDIAAARREFVMSFGSCSFEEPCADLRSLGWL